MSEEIPGSAPRQQNHYVHQPLWRPNDQNRLWWLAESDQLCIVARSGDKCIPIISAQTIGIAYLYRIATDSRTDKCIGIGSTESFGIAYVFATALYRSGDKCIVWNPPGTIGIAYYYQNPVDSGDQIRLIYACLSIRRESDGIDQTCLSIRPTVCPVGRLKPPRSLKAQSG